MYSIGRISHFKDIFISQNQGFVMIVQCFLKISIMLLLTFSTAMHVEVDTVCSGLTFFSDHKNSFHGTKSHEGVVFS